MNILDRIRKDLRVAGIAGDRDRVARLQKELTYILDLTLPKKGKSEPPEETGAEKNNDDGYFVLVDKTTGKSPR